jgi:3-phosphoshikimate 1-carboxyvinyltransferase
MNARIDKSIVRGVVQVPSSKSMTIRALICAALSWGSSDVINPLVCDDTNAAADVLGRVGIDIKKENGIWKVKGGSLRAAPGKLHCGESAATMRFMIAVCALIPGKHTLVGGPSLSSRPVQTLVDTLNKMGIKGSASKDGTPPVVIEGGALKGGLAEIPGDISSQFISALLLIAPFADKELTVKLTTRMTSAPYVLMTIWCLRKFGIKVRQGENAFMVSPQRYIPASLDVEGDWSSASYFLALGAVSEKGITVENLNIATLQGDSIIIDFLRRMGANVKIEGKSVTVSKNELHGIKADLSDCTDLLPTVAALAALADGKSEFSGIARARIKESNRVAVMKEGLQKLGVNVTEDDNHLAVVGLKTECKAGNPELIQINSYGDHRIAMAFSIIGAAQGGIVIEGAECVAKTFPEYWKVFRSVGGAVKKNV